MLPDLLGIATAGAVVALPFLFRRRGRVFPAAGAPAVPPEAHRTARGAAVPSASSAERQPYDSGVLAVGEVVEP
jgi:hypothetical protein